MSNNLLCPIQLRMNDIKLFDYLNFFIEKPEHTITLQCKQGGDYCIPLSFNSVTSYFPTRKPTQDEYNTAEYDDSTVDLTYDAPEWNPHSDMFNDQEVIAQNTVDTKSLSPNRLFCSVQTQRQVDATVMLDRTLEYIYTL